MFEVVTSSSIGGWIECVSGARIVSGLMAGLLMLAASINTSVGGGSISRA